MKQISFGTSGWRDIIADGFTFDGVRALTRAVARELKKKKMGSRGVVVGHDSRFLSENFAAFAAQILSEEGLPVYLVEASTPTPVLATAILDLKCAGGINFTASHNPAQYQGFKWSNHFGGPATKEEVAPIEKAANVLLAQGGGQAPRGVKPGKITKIDPKKAYFRRLHKKVAMEVLKAAKLSVVADPLFGAGHGYLDVALKEAGCKLEVMHDWRDPLFGGGSPEPNGERLAEAASLMKKKRGQLTLGTDGDADRFGVVDRDGTYITPNEVLALIVYLLVKHRGLKGRVVRSVVSSHLIDAVAKHYGLSVEVTPVGFKYIGESMQRPGFLIGGEESGGLTIAGHVPEKDGILACLLIAELVAREQKSLKQILQHLYRQVGTLYTDRLNVTLDSLASGKRLKAKLEHFRPQSMAGKRVAAIDRMDGFKYILDNDSWLAIRLSGTEPVARLYLEAHSPQELKKLLSEGKRLLANA